jgi:hypothetical protein
MLYKNTTQKLYIGKLYLCDPQTQLNNFITQQKILKISKNFWKSKEVVNLRLRITYV